MTKLSVVVSFGRPLYAAREFTATTEAGTFVVSGTLCGHIDFVAPGHRGCCVLSPEEVLLLIVALQGARTDVLDNSDPYHDPRIMEC